MWGMSYRQIGILFDYPILNFPAAAVIQWDVGTKNINSFGDGYLPIWKLEFWNIELLDKGHG